MQAGEQMLLGGRTINMLADLPITVPAQAIDRVCCSGMSAIHRSAMEIELGYSDVCIACGMDHMTHLGMDLQYNPHAGATPTFMQPEYAKKYDLMVTMNMGLTAEKLFEEAKEEFGVTKEDLDKWGVRSYNHKRLLRLKNRL